MSMGVTLNDATRFFHFKPLCLARTPVALSSEYRRSYRLPAPDEYGKTRLSEGTLRTEATCLFGSLVLAPLCTTRLSAPIWRVLSPFKDACSARISLSYDIKATEAKLHPSCILQNMPHPSLGLPSTKLEMPREQSSIRISKSQGN